MNLSKRQAQIVMLLMDAQQNVKTKDLAERFGVTDRTVRNDLDMIAYVLEKEALALDRARQGIGIIGSQKLQSSHCKRNLAYRALSKTNVY